MGSPLSPIIADMVMQDLESNVLKKLPFKPNFYYRYVNDIILTAPSDELQNITRFFNSYDTRLQFIIETQKDNSISFLDTKLIVLEDRIISDWYHKNIFSGRYLNYYSTHPMTQKIGTIISMINRIMLLYHLIFQEKILDS